MNTEASIVPKKLDLKSLCPGELENFFLSLGEKKYRAVQLINWIYRKGAVSFDQMTDISLALREKLKASCYISELKLIKEQNSFDGTKKYLFGLEDNQRIESVLIPDEDRLTVCVSTQVGCAYACRFCATGRIGFVRNLNSAEIVNQILAIKKELKNRPITNIVFMGMGEPLANFNETVKAVLTISHPKGLNFGPRRITVSTVGLIPEIYRLAELDIPANLAVSLNATTDEIRSYLMPINKKYPIRELLEACRKFPLRGARRRITFEYVCIDNLNDTLEDAHRLAALLSGIKCKINLIQFNEFPGSEFKPTPIEKMLKFQKALKEKGFTVTIRESRGKDIQAACGQLTASI